MGGSPYLHYMAKCLWTPNHHIYVSLLGIPFLNHGHPTFAAIKASSLLGRFSTSMERLGEFVLIHSKHL